MAAASPAEQPTSNTAATPNKGANVMRAIGIMVGGSNWAMRRPTMAVAATMTNVIIRLPKYSMNHNPSRRGWGRGTLCRDRSN